MGKSVYMAFLALLAGLMLSVPLLAQSDTDTSPGKTEKTATAIADSDSDGGLLPNSKPVAAPTAEPAPLKDEIAKEEMPEIKVTVFPEKGAIGDLIEWKVIVHRKSVQERVVLPSSFDFGKLEIQSRTVKGEESGEKSLTQVMGIGLVALDTGEFNIPPQKLTVVDGKGNLSEVMTPAFTLTIDSLIANEPEPSIKADEKDGEVVMVDDFTLLYVAIAVLAVLVTVLLTLLVRKLLSLRKPKPGPPPPPPRPAHEVALEKLNALRNSGYLDEQMHKRFHLKLSETSREYLGNRYHFDALECSTREIVDALRRLSLKVELHRDVVQLLEDTDLVKFARYIPPREESERLLEEAFRIVEITRDTPASAAAPKGAAATQDDVSEKGRTDDRDGGER
jgi:hypothetical protein